MSPSNNAACDQDGYKTWLSAIAREAVTNARPHTGDGPKPDSALCWANSPKWACAYTLIQRTVDLRKEVAARPKPANNEDDPDKLYAMEIQTVMREASRKARNHNVTKLREVFFGDSPHQIAKNILPDKQGDFHADAELTPALSHINHIEDLKTLLSGPLRSDPELYTIFVAGLAAGKLTRSRKMPQSVPLENFVSVDFEAHYRVELFYCLEKRGMRHSCTDEACRRRTEVKTPQSQTATCMM